MLKKSLLIAIIAASIGYSVTYQTPAPPLPTNQIVITKPNSAVSHAVTAAKILHPNKRSGGSAVILSSSPTGSILLTNKHVCSLVQTGGYVRDANGRDLIVRGYKVYPKHDLCLVKVDENLGINTMLALLPPRVFSPARVSGHPQLLPMILSTGHFSNPTEVDIMVDLVPCDGSEKDDEIMYCFFMGGKPLIKRFHSQVISCLIAPGSSGSGVFNDAGELSGLVFAGGSEGLSYGYIVPFEAVRDFVINADSYKWHTPDPNATSKNFLAAMFKVKDACQVGLFGTFCRKTRFPAIWRGE